MKELLQFLKSKVFVLNLSLALLLLMLLSLGVLEWLKFSTHHNEVVQVPKLEELSTGQAQEVLEQLGLNLAVMDTVTYFNEQMAMGAVIEQIPRPCSYVKEGRVIRVIVNRQGYREIPIPEVVQVTKRNAQLLLNSSGFEVDTVTKISRIGHNMVYKVKLEGETIQPGDSVPRASELELVVGTGR